jgi:hypothetical protein
LFVEKIFITLSRDKQLTQKANKLNQQSIKLSVPFFIPSNPNFFASSTPSQPKMILRSTIVLTALLAVQFENVAPFSTGPAFQVGKAGITKGGIPPAFVTPDHEKSLKPVGRSPTKLEMGKVEEFLTGRDEKTRKADNEKYLATLQKRVDRINELEADIEELDDDELVAKTEEFRKRLKDGEDINGPLLEETFAVVREAAW